MVASPVAVARERLVLARALRQRNQNPQNEPGMCFRINETEKRVRKEAPKPALRSSLAGLKPFIANRLHCGYRASPGWIDLYHIAGTRLMLHIAAIRGKFSEKPGSRWFGNQRFQSNEGRKTKPLCFIPSICLIPAPDRLCGRPSNHILAYLCSLSTPARTFRSAAL